MGAPHDVTRADTTCSANLRKQAEEIAQAVAACCKSTTASSACRLAAACFEREIACDFRFEDRKIATLARFDAIDPQQTRDQKR